MNSKHRKIYHGIVQSTALLGAVRVLTIFIGFARDKALALLLGPTGIGIFGIFDSLVTTVVTTSSLGTNVSGVRAIATSSSLEDGRQVGHSIATVRTLTIILGSLGALGMAIFCVPISRLTFGKSGYEVQVLVISLSVFFTSLVCGYRAQLQGLNQIRELAKVGGMAALASAIILVVTTAIWGMPAIAPALSASALSTAILFWYATRQTAAQRASLTWPIFHHNAKQLITLGVSLAAALFFSTLVGYAIRTMINRDLGLAEAGFYMAGFGISGKSIGFLLDSMQADLFPRLSAAANDHTRLNDLISGQTEICLLLTVPGIMLTITLSPYLLRMFYSVDFMVASPLLAWFSLGSLAKVIATPLGYVRLAMGRGKVFFFTELGFAVLQLVMIVAGLKWWGLSGTVIAYVAHAGLRAGFLAYTANYLTGFFWSRASLRLALALLPITVLVFLIGMFGSPVFAATVGSSIAIATGLFNLRELVSRLGPDHRLSRIVRRVPLLNRVA